MSSVFVFRPTDEPHDTVVPSGYVDNLAQAIDLLIKCDKKSS